MAKVLPPTRSVENTEPELLSKVREFIAAKNQIDKLTKIQSDIKAELMEAVELYGEVDDKGSFRLDLPEEIDGYVALSRQRRVSMKLDMDEAEKILNEKGLYQRCVKLEPVVDEDAVMSALYEGMISEEEIDTMYPKTITWAFMPNKK